MISLKTIRQSLLGATLMLVAVVAHAQNAPTPNGLNINPFTNSTATAPTRPATTAQTSPAPASPANSSDIHDIHSLAPLTYWERNGMRIIISSVGGVILLGLIIWILLRKTPAKVTTPYQIALREIDAARALTVGAQDQAFAIAASDAVRHYLENAYKMPAPERTTEEFLQEASRQAWLQGELAELLRKFLEFCDLAKFAGQELGGTEREQLLSAAREFVDAAEKLRQPPPGAKPSPQNPPTPPPPAQAAEPSLTTP